MALDVGARIETLAPPEVNDVKKSDANPVVTLPEEDMGIIVHEISDPKRIAVAPTEGPTQLRTERVLGIPNTVYVFGLP